jgi:TatD DNase family protein
MSLPTLAARPFLALVAIILLSSIARASGFVVGRQSTFQSRISTQRASSILMSSTLKFVDIGANLLDERFTEGSYNGKVRHEPDWEAVMERAVQSGVTHIILTAGTLRESRRALELVRELRPKNETIQFGCTVGVHPTRCAQEFVDSEMPAEQVLDKLLELAQDGQTDQSVVALGEMGLDYDRLE